MAARSGLPFDREQAFVDPATVFASPEAVVTHPAFSQVEKSEILQRWEYDAAEIAVAVEEGMPGGEDTMLRRVTLALREVAGPLDVDRTATGKHHAFRQGQPGRWPQRRAADPRVSPRGSGSTSPRPR